MVCTFVTNKTITDMKKTFALLFASAVMTAAFAQNKPKAGELIYGTITDSNGPVAGAVVTERNNNDRIIAQTLTDDNGNFAFRLIKSKNSIMVTKRGFETINIPIEKSHLELSMKARNQLPDIAGGTAQTIQTPDEILRNIIVPGAATEWGYNRLPGNGLHIPYSNTTYYTIDDLFNNWYL